MPFNNISLQKTKVTLDVDDDKSFHVPGILEHELMNKDSFNKLLRKLDTAYHNQSTPLVTDDRYDSLVDLYEQRFGKYNRTGALPLDNDPEDKDVLKQLTTKSKKHKLVYSETTKNKKNKNELDKLAAQGGELVNHKIKIGLTWLLPSLDKAKDDQRLKKWLESIEDRTVYVSDKVDGISALLDLSHPDKVLLCTRGNGRIGRDITHLLAHLQGIPSIESLREWTSQRVNNGRLGGVRMELVLRSDAFNELRTKGRDNKKFSNPRNTLAGIVNGKRFFKEDARLIDTIAYDLYYLPVQQQSGSLRSSKEDEIEDLKQLGFHSPGFEKLKATKINYDLCAEQINNRRSRVDYEMDGIVLNCNVSLDCVSIEQKQTVSAADLWLSKTENKEEIDELDDEDGNVELPWHSIAFKITGERVKTTVKSVEWRVTRYAELAPRVWIEPVQCGGTIISKATGHSARYIYDSKLGPGSILEIYRAGDTIPKIGCVETPATNQQPDMPDKNVWSWEWNETKVDLVVKVDDRVLRRRTIAFFSDMNAEGIGPQVAGVLHDAFKGDLGCILRCTVEDLLKLDGFKQTKAENTIQSIKKCMNRVPLHRVMIASSQFGSGIGTVAFQQAIEFFDGKIIEWKSTKENRSILANDLQSLPDWGEITATKFANSLGIFLKWLKVLPEIKYIVPSPKGYVQAHIVELPKVVAFSLFRSTTWEDFLRQHQTSVVSTITKNCECLIVKEKNSGKSKEKKALEMKIPIYTADEFRRKYKIPE